MRKIHIYHPYDWSQIENNSIVTKNYKRDYQRFFDDLTIELKKKYFVTEFNFSEHRDPSQGRFVVNLIKQTCKPDEFVTMECNYVIEFQDTGEFYVLSVCDDLDEVVLNEKSNPFLKKALFAQWVTSKMEYHMAPYMEKYAPWIYFPTTNIDLEHFYNLRKENKNYIKKLHFGGETSYRPILDFFDKEYLHIPKTSPQSEYFYDLIKYSVGLSVSGCAELCYRDVEYMALGIPFIRFEYQSSFMEPLIPNYHYISLDFDVTIPKINETHRDRLGGYVHAKKIESRFVELKNNPEYLEYIANNARKYYLDNFSSTIRIKKTLEALGI